MTFLINAIVDNGVFKPLEPIALPDHSAVRLIVEPLATTSAEENEAVVRRQKQDARELAAELAEIPDTTRDEVERQRRAILDLELKLTEIPDLSPDDGFSGSDHDRLLYGKPA